VKQKSLQSNYLKNECTYVYFTYETLYSRYTYVWFRHRFDELECVKMAPTYVVSKLNQLKMIRSFCAISLFMTSAAT